MDRVWQVVVSAFGIIASYFLFLIKKNKDKSDLQTSKITDHDREIALIKQTLNGMNDKMQNVLDLGSRLEKSNSVILRVLTANARKNKNQNKD
jgi:hypothetical protein